MYKKRPNIGAGVTGFGHWRASRATDYVKEGSRRESQPAVNPDGDSDSPGQLALAKAGVVVARVEVNGAEVMMPKEG